MNHRRREGDADGLRIVSGFKDQPYIQDLARNPLMLSAVCLVNYFEGGQLPKDRALLYQLCVEGLLHHWDQRRGIHSEFGLGEKLQACREVACAMQTDDRAEYEVQKLQGILSRVLADPVRAATLLEHVRYRTGLLLERRQGVFAFAHLTFQEYLTAQAVLGGNQRGLDVDQFVREHDDARWREVIALYCGSAPPRESRRLVELLLQQQDTLAHSTVLGEAYLSSAAEVLRDQPLRKRVIERIAIAPTMGPTLGSFPDAEVADISNAAIGATGSELGVSGAFRWFQEHPRALNARALARLVQHWERMSPFQATEIMFLLHGFAPPRVLAGLPAQWYWAPGPQFRGGESYLCLGEIAALGIWGRNPKPSAVLDRVFLRLMEAIVSTAAVGPTDPPPLRGWSFGFPERGYIPVTQGSRQTLAKLVAELRGHIGNARPNTGLLERWEALLVDRQTSDRPEGQPRLSRRPRAK